MTPWFFRVTLLLCTASLPLRAAEGMIDDASEHSVAETADRLWLVVVPTVREARPSAAELRRYGSTPLAS
jgi:hypothetical protein